MFNMISWKGMNPGMTIIWTMIVLHSASSVLVQYSTITESRVFPFYFNNHVRLLSNTEGNGRLLATLVTATAGRVLALVVVFSGSAGGGT